MAISDMTLAEKIRYLREVEGSLREMGRPMTQLELVNAIRREQGKSISQSYISQIENGSRRHMTQEVGNQRTPPPPVWPLFARTAVETVICQESQV